MFLKGKLVALRAMEPADNELLYEWENDISLWPVSYTQVPFSKALLQNFTAAEHQDIYTNRQLRLMVVNATDDEVIGILDLFDFEPQHNRCGIGIFIHQTQRRQGFASETIELVKQYAFELLHLRQIYAQVNESNTESLLLFEKCGFEKSGLKKQWHRVGQNNYENVWFLQCINNGD